jgi:EAL domain-containing protein (putative c-di-GMP-specific phosphodiesterase class I)
VTVALYLRWLGRVALELRLRRAMRRGELTLFFQPKASMATGRLVGAEALVRWIDPKRGTRHPDEWIGCVERGRCARRFNLHVLDLAIGQMCAWQRQGRSLAVSVNLSPRALAQPGLPSEVARLLAKWDVDARLLEIEITELAIAESGSDTLLEAMARLRALGVSLSIDDFGVGHSSLDRLAELPVAALKIDRSFVMRMGDGDERSESIVRAAIDLAHDLAITPVAEGVESESVWHRLRALGCTRAQGYLLSRPLPPEELTRAAGPHGRLTARLLALAPPQGARRMRLGA